MMPTVFVGGTGRSGTTILAQLIGAHPAYAMIPIEVRFIVGPGGLCDLIDGRHGFAMFERKMLGIWYHRELPDGQVRGLRQIVEHAELEAALRSLRRQIVRDPLAAGRRFVHRLLDPIAPESGGWVEMTPPNMLAADQLVRLFPGGKLIHVIRDGRDTACSVASMGWGPNDLDEALDWWADRLVRGFAASASLPEGRLHEVWLESLVRDDREREYTRLLDFLELADDAATRSFFASSVTAASAHIGRWRRDVPADRRSAFEAHHEAIVDRLRASGIAAAYPMAEGLMAGVR